MGTNALTERGRRSRHHPDRLQAIEQKLDALLSALANNGESGSSRYLLWPAKGIAKVCGVHDRTIRKWVQDKRHPLKVIHTGKGLVTTLGLLDEWVRGRWEQESTHPPPRKGRPLLGQLGALRVRVQETRE